MWKKRAIVVLTVFICIVGMLAGRLVQIQLLATEKFSRHQVNLLEGSVKQRSQEMVIDSGRGTFLDRNGEPLNSEKLPVLVLFPFLENMTWDVQKVAQIIGTSETALLSSVRAAKEPFAYGDPSPLILTEKQMKQINALKIPGVFAVERKYGKSDVLAEHLLGITGQNNELLHSRYPDLKMSIETVIGLTGLENSFDEFLLSDGKSKLVYHVDGKGGPLFGLNVKYVEPSNPFYPVNIKTTLDKELQKLGETLVDQHGIKKGGLVLLDIETNSVLAMVSRPKINRDAPYDEESGSLRNRMVTQQIPGSVFKTVVAAAAIEQGLDKEERQFDCDKAINGEKDENYQYGMLSFKESFARSCNNTFGILAKELKKIDENLLEEYARKLSLTGPVSWTGDIYHFRQFQQLQDEENGRVFLDEKVKKDDNFVALTGIGQHEVRVTPLAVANMMATIAKGGKREMVKVVSEIEYKNGSSFIPFPEKVLPGERISPYTAMKLQRLLREVVKNENGTGHTLNDLPYEVAGKSGTAETGIYRGKKQLYNKWFAGYFPYARPKYALVAVNLEVEENEGAVQPLFADMVKGIYEQDRKSEK